ncbi:hypothetical protein [Gelidibacter pelagius]|nr:hypothetical protein [Gelidibacter pelagius]
MSLSDRGSNGIFKVLRIFVNIVDVEYLSGVHIRSAIQHRSLTKFL